MTTINKVEIIVLNSMANYFYNSLFKEIKNSFKNTTPEQLEKLYYNQLILLIKDNEITQE